MTATSTLKKFLLRYLPEPLLTPIRASRYLRTLRTLSLEDERDLGLVDLLVKTGDCVVDIGANYGVYTKYLSQRVGKSGRVMSIEPIRTTFSILRSCVKRLGLDNVDLFQCALSDRPGTVTMMIPRYETGGKNLYQARIVETSSTDGTTVERVSSSTLDNLTAKVGGPVSFIKCDVEGHELRCLGGAAETITRWMPSWLIEIAGDPDQPESQASRVLALMESYGYGVFWYDGTKIHRRREGNESINYLFLTPTHASSLRCAGILAET